MSAYKILILICAKDTLDISGTRAACHDALVEPKLAEAEIMATVAAAEEAGQSDQTLLASYHLGLRRYAATGAETEAAVLIDLTRRMAAAGGPASFYDPLHVQSETAAMLTGSEHEAAALEFARAALVGKVAMLGGSRDSALGQEGAHTQVRGIAETLLWAAHTLDSEGAGVDCSRDEAAGHGCVISHHRP